MNAEYNGKTKNIDIQLRGTLVESEHAAKPSISQGTATLTSFGARQLAYQLLSAADIADHYKDKT